jgi:hypothetical protein
MASMLSRLDCTPFDFRRVYHSLVAVYLVLIDREHGILVRASSATGSSFGALVSALVEA